MSPILHVSLTAGMLLFSVTGLCCALVGDRRRDDGNQGMRPPTPRGLCVSLSGAVWMAVMLLAMVDISTASITLLSEAAWALSLLLACPVSVGTALRGKAFVARDSLSIGMTLHRGLSLLVMGMLIVLVHPETKPPITAVSDVHPSWRRDGYYSVHAHWSRRLLVIHDLEHMGLAPSSGVSERTTLTPARDHLIGCCSGLHDGDDRLRWRHPSASA